MSTMTSDHTTTRTTVVCTLGDLEQNLGAVALLDDGTQVALFHVDSEVYAVSNIDPYMGAAVISRGIVGEYDGVPTVASPLLKQRFRLTDGHSLEDEQHVLETYPVEIEEIADAAGNVPEDARRIVVTH